MKNYFFLSFFIEIMFMNLQKSRLRTQKLLILSFKQKLKKNIISFFCKKSEKYHYKWYLVYRPDQQLFNTCFIIF